MSKWRRRLPVGDLDGRPGRLLAAAGSRRAGCAADTYDQTVIAQSLAMAIIFLSFVVVTGMGGMVSLMQASFVTAGGFAAGWALTHDLGVDIPCVSTHGQINFFWARRDRRAGRRRARRAARVPLTRLGGVNFAIWARWRWAFFLSLVVLGRPSRSATARPAGRSAPRRSTSPASTGSTTCHAPCVNPASRSAEARLQPRSRSRSCCSSRCSVCSRWSSTRCSARVRARDPRRAQLGGRGRGVGHRGRTGRRS